MLSVIACWSWIIPIVVVEVTSEHLGDVLLGSELLLVESWLLLGQLGLSCLWKGGLIWLICSHSSHR